MRVGKSGGVSDKGGVRNRMWHTRDSTREEENGNALLAHTSPSAAK